LPHADRKSSIYSADSKRRRRSWIRRCRNRFSICFVQEGIAVLNTSKLIAFVATTNSEKAQAFYEQKLGLTLSEDTPFALVFEANGVMLRVQKVQSLNPASHTVLGWHVADIRRTIATLVEKGVVFERFAGVSQDEQGIWSAPSGAQVAWFKDPDGNILSLTQF
jgi:predicted enzyme related to lactoylglutathione lyase